jgi:DNA modification methylase
MPDPTSPVPWQNRIVGHATVPAKDLLANPLNWRIHPTEQQQALARVLDKVGWVQDVVVNRTSGFIVDGHLRAVLAAEQDQVVPVAYVELTPEEEKLILATFDQITGMAVPDAEKLAALMGEVTTDFPDLADMLDRITNAGQEEQPQPEEGGLTEEDAAPEPPAVPVTAKGDIWLLGPHRLLCGDATDAGDVEKVMDGERAAMAFTDPPYNVAYEGKTSRKLKIQNDHLGSAFHNFLRDASKNILAFCDGAVYICMSSSELHTLHHAFLEAGGHWSTFIIWVKNHFTLGWGDYLRQYEPLLYGWREGQSHVWAGGRDQGDAWMIDRPVASREHPTMKPVELVQRALRNNSTTRQAVLDTFGGSGTTIIACQKMGRRARVIELDPRYCDVAVQRWQEYTGREATLEGRGATFAAMKLERASVGQPQPAAA